MSGIGRYVVGHRKTDPRLRNRTDVREAGRCISCGHVTWFFASGIANAREKDSAIVCDDCHQRPDIKANLQREL